MPGNILPNNPDLTKADQYPNHLLKDAIVNQVVDIFMGNKARFPSYHTVNDQNELTHLYVINNVEITSEVFTIHPQPMSLVGRVMVGCRIQTNPVKSKGDGTHYANEAIIQLLSLFKGTMISSDEKGIYLLW